MLAAVVPRLGATSIVTSANHRRVDTYRNAVTKKPSMACCKAASTEKDVATFEAEEQRGVVQEYYGKELQGTEDLKV